MTTTPTQPWYTSVALYVNVLSIAAVALYTAGSLSGQLELTTQQIALGTVALAVINAVIRVFGTNKPISIAGWSPAAERLERELRGK